MTGAAEQALVLGDPDALQVLTLVMTDPRGSAGRDDLVGPGVSSRLVQACLDRLSVVGLVEQSGAGGRYTATAEAYMRFGSVVEPAAPPGRATVRAHAAALDRVAADLAVTFRGVFSEQTVARYVHDSYDVLARRARVAQHLPVLAARFARDRLSALARGEGKVPRDGTDVLFVCVRNAARSQIAAAALRRHAGGSVSVRTAGSAPTSGIDPEVVAAISRRGWSPALEFPKPLTDEVVRGADVVVSLGCGDACPVYPGRHYLDWDVLDPAEEGVDIEAVVTDLEWRVLGLLRQIGAWSPTR
ncbi:low molecular weight phosphatase family protein [Cellulomonas sp. C5510]|uniref:arsenate-mycothiol transferase ArsC n=1 Tax=Cellulomonas sp. C5510 TaxID=2871170 RepID=UPI001C96A22D|nr:hypothetical protein [Cellulomonas sp. C5510]QZN85921.1 hypothetical protein K5O09_01470 [Cellulomonas sp. C5510]